MVRVYNRMFMRQNGSSGLWRCRCQIKIPANRITQLHISSSHPFSRPPLDNVGTLQMVLENVARVRDKRHSRPHHYPAEGVPYDLMGSISHKPGCPRREWNPITLARSSVRKARQNTADPSVKSCTFCGNGRTKHPAKPYTQMPSGCVRKKRASFFG